MKYPPYSWLRLSGSINQHPSRMWFSFDDLPKEQSPCSVRVHIGSASTSVADPFDAIADATLLLPRQKKVLERFLKIAKPTKKRGEFTLDHASFSSLLPFSSAVPFEVFGVGVISAARQNARIKATVSNRGEPNEAIVFSLVKNSIDPLKNPRFFGDVNAYVIDEELRLYPIFPHITQAEAEAVLASPPLPLLGLCEKNSRDIFYALSRLGIDFSCLNELAVIPEYSQIVLRLLLNIDDLSKKMCARAHLVTELKEGEFCDEVEIESTGNLSPIHVAAEDSLEEMRFQGEISAPKLIRRPHIKETEARNFLYQLGAGPSRHHDGFELYGEDAMKLLRSVADKGKLPDYIRLDDNTRPEIIELSDRPKIIITSDSPTPTRVDVAISLGQQFDKTGANFALICRAKDNLVVFDEDTLIVFTEQVKANVQYFAESLSLEAPGEKKSKSVAQIALMHNALGDKMEIVAEPELLEYLKTFSILPLDSDRTLPKTLQTTLRPYQHDAVAWLSSLNRSGLGGLLGDEMGLGKTLMVLVHLARLKENGVVNKPALVVCPTSVIDVWQAEAVKHIPTLRAIKWHGPERFAQLDDLMSYDIVITSYAILRRDIESHFGNLQFSTLILDEAQYVRNQQTDSFKSAKAVKCQHRIALTGTPIENHLTDLFNILDCVEEGVLGNRLNFEKRFGTPIESGEAQSLVTLKMLLAPIVTRRKKSEVESELPPKIENVVSCELSDVQKDLYRRYVDQLSGTLKDATKGSGSQAHFTLLSALTRLRQICCHPSLILGNEGNDKPSGKIDALREIISECLEMGRKIIIYSQFLKMQEHIVDVVKELSPTGALWLHGSSKNRQEIVATFQNPNGPKVIVVSLKAGGTGITLTEADTVIFADPWWNPAVEDQAIDRAHRIGQKKTVHVIRLIAADSIECEVVDLAHKKRKAAYSVLHGGFSKTANLTKDEVKSLLLHEVDRLK